MMKMFFASLCLCTALAVSTAQAAPGVASRDPARMPQGAYVLDPTHSSLVVLISHLGFSSYTLRFDGLEGGFVYDPTHPEATALKVQVDPSSIDTQYAPLTKELKGAKWLNIEKFPTTTFVSTAVRPGSDGHGQVVGLLTFMGVSRPVTLDVVFNGSGVGIMGDTRAGFSATTTLRRSDFGPASFAPMIGDDLTLQIQTEFVRK